MGKTIKFKNELDPIYGECQCGCKLFMLKLNPGDQTTVTNLVCSACECSVPVEQDAGFDFSCEVE